MQEITFKEFELNDLSMIFDWFQNPETKKWYARGKDWSFDEIKEKYEPRLLGKEIVPSFIIHLDGNPIGFIQYYPFSEGSLPEGVSADAVKELGINCSQSAGIDLFIGEEELIGAGLGSIIMSDFIESIIPRQYINIFVDPDKDNARAIKSYLKLGFHVDDRFNNDAHQVMVLNRENIKVNIKSQRLIVREPYYLEADKIKAFLIKNKKYLQNYDPIRPEKYYTDTFWQDRIKERDKKNFDQRGIQLFLFLEQDSSKTIGYINFDNVVRGCFQSCTLGYCLDEEYQGKGYMAETLSLGISYVFAKMNLHRIQVNYIKDNIRSERLLKKLDFVVEGMAKDYLLINGKWQDHIMTSLINKNWKPS